MNTKHLRQAGIKDIDTIRKFLSKIIPSPTFIKQLESRLSMWWTDNPAMDDMTPIGWILEDNQADIVGFIANIPFRYQIFGKKDTAVACSSWYVKPEARGMAGTQLLLSFLRQQGKNLYIINQPVEGVLKIMTTAGLAHAPLPYKSMEYMYILKLDQMLVLFLSRILKNPRVFPIIKFMAIPIKIFSPLFNMSRRMQKPAFTKQKSSHGDEEYRCSLVDHCDESFTRLWEENKRTNQITLYRDSEILNWLYFSKTIAHQRRVIQCVDRKDDSLVGYLAFDIIDFQKIKIKIFRLVDVYIPDLNESILSSLMSFAIEQAKKNTTAAMRIWARDQDMDNILRQWFKTRRKFDYSHYYKLNVPDHISTKNIEQYDLCPSPIEPERGTIAFYSSLYY